MRKRVFPRILWFLLLNCVVFIALVTMQFTRRGSFSQRIGDMLITGRYSSETDEFSEWRLLDGGANVVFGGLEFRLAAAPGARADTGLRLVDSQDRRYRVSPEYAAFTENGVTFVLSGGTEISFISQNSANTPELQISGKLSNNISAIEIPLRTQRSSVIRSNNNDTLNVLYSGSSYQFSRPLYSLESGQLVLLVSAAAISYHVVTDKSEFNPVDFIIPQAETAQAFSGAVSKWINQQFALWSEMGQQTDEDTVIAWCGESVRQDAYRSAVSVIPVSFSTSPLRTWESAVYQFDRRIGVWERASRTVDSFEREKISLVNRLLAEKSNTIFIENHLIEFMAIRDRSQLIDNILSFVQGVDPLSINLEMCPGILENCLDIDKWRPNSENHFELLTERVYQLIAEGVHKNKDRVLVFIDDRADVEFNMRLGKALFEWAEKTGNDDWAALGRSLALSVISLSDASGLIPISLTSGGGDFIPFTERISAAKMYRILNNNNEYLPRWVATGADGVWAWTAAENLSIAQNSTMMDISIRFPVGETHYVMLRNVKPFPLMQIYGMDWRRAVDFENYYNSSGWYYFEQEQTLVIKMSQHETVESVKIYYTVPRTPAPESAPAVSPAPLSPPVPEPVPTERPYQF